MSPQIDNVTVRIKADTRAFDRSIRHLKWSLWLMHWGPWAVIVGSFLFGLGIGIAAGVLGS